MANEKTKTGKGLFGRLRARMAGIEPESVEAAEMHDAEKQKLIEEFEAVKRNPGHLTGWDFDRAFDFIERYPDTPQAEILIGQMYATHGTTLKGLSYPSAVKVLQRMPGHPGAQAIVKGMYAIEKDYINELRSDVICFMLQTIHDHPLAEELTTALVLKNLTNAYDFVVTNPDNIYTKQIIKAMFDRDPNIAVLLLQEKMDHPQVSSIFEGIYNILSEEQIKKLTPNAILFILEVAPDHPQAERIMEALVESNYIKAFDFVRNSPDHLLAEKLRRLILLRKPELAKLFADKTDM